MKPGEHEDKEIPFGKYKGTLIADCEKSYLVWLLEQDWFCEKFTGLVKQIRIELKYRDDFDIKD